jgi:hypothetical protein
VLAIMVAARRILSPWIFIMCYLMGVLADRLINEHVT